MAESVELSTVLKDEARLFACIAGKSGLTTGAELGLPEDARAICHSRKEQVA